MSHYRVVLESTPSALDAIVHFDSRSVPLTAGEAIVLGRGDDADVQLPEGVVSRHHLSLGWAAATPRLSNSVPHAHAARSGTRHWVHGRLYGGTDG